MGRYGVFMGRSIPSVRLVSRVELGDVAADVVLVEVGVDFGGGDALVAEHLLHGAQVGAALH